MKLYILTHSGSEENYTPMVFKTELEAITELKNIYEDLVYDNNYPDEPRGYVAEYDSDNDKYVSEYVDNYEFYDTAAEIIYKDDTYDRFDIFEVEMN